MKKTRQTIIVRSLAVAFAGGAALASVPSLAADDAQTVVVTAQSRKQSVQDVPIAMQVVNMKDIENLGAKDLADLNGYIPGLKVDNEEPTQPSFGIRGVQPGDFGIATDAPVGIYVDGVYTGKTGGALMNFIDVQRIEVIKGPQGTLFGRNSAAGAISIVTNEPSQDADMTAHALIGNRGKANMDAMVNMPLTDTAAARFVFVRSGSDGWITNQVTGKDMGGDHAWATRLSLKNTVGQTKINFSWEHEKMKQDGRPAIGVVTNPALPLGGYRGVYDAAYLRNFVDPFNTPLTNDVTGSEWRNFDGATLRFETPLAGMTFNSTTAYRGFDTFNYTDNDGMARNDLYLATLDAKKARSWQQEFKLSAKNDSLDWIAGLSLFDNKEHQDAGAFVTTGTLDTLSLFGGGGADFATLFGTLGAFGVPGVSGSTVYRWDEVHYSDVATKSVSLYGDVIWHLSQNTNVTTGLRWTKDKKKMTWYVPGRVSPELDAFIRAYGPLVPPAFGGPLSPASFPPNVVFAAASQLAATPVSRSKDWTDLSPRLVIDHKLNADTLLFASISKGYQAGGFNIFTPPNPASTSASKRDPSFSPEKMTNLEAGFKLVFPAAKAVLNASLFAYKFKNLQDINLESTSPGAIPTYNVESSDQKAKGLDLDGRIKLNKNVALFGGLEYINQTYSKFKRVDDAGVVTLDLSGQAVGTPYVTAMGGVNVTWDAMGGHSAFTLQGTHSSKKRCNSDSGVECISIATLETGTATTKVDMRLGWENADRRFGTALIVNNLFDKRYVTSLGGQTETFGMPYASITPPRFVGIEFKATM